MLEWTFPLQYIRFHVLWKLKVNFLIKCLMISQIIIQLIYNIFFTFPFYTVKIKHYKLNLGTSSIANRKISLNISSDIVVWIIKTKYILSDICGLKHVLSTKMLPHLFYSIRWAYSICQAMHQAIIQCRTPGRYPNAVHIRRDFIH